LRAELIAYAQAQFDLAKQTPDGSTQREHLLAVERSTGVSIAELHPSPLPDGCQLLWDSFIELHNSRGGGMGPSPIGWRDLQAWQEVRRVTLSTWEIDTLMMLDRVAMTTLNEKKTP
jgi:hypothetical protein